MEILVATVIFVAIMVIATGVIAQGSSYSGKIKRLRETSQDARRLADMITRDIKAANAPVILNSELLHDATPSDFCDQGPDAGTTVTFKSGLVILAWRRAVDGYTANPEIQSYCIDEWYKIPDGLFYGNGHGYYDARMLVVGLKDKTRVYATAQDLTVSPRVHRVYMKEFPSGATLMPSDLPGIIDSANLISNPNYGAIIGFGGYAPPSSTNSGKPLSSTIRQQPIIRFIVTVQSSTYQHNDLVVPIVHRGEQAVIQSMVTSRNYDI